MGRSELLRNRSPSVQAPPPALDECARGARGATKTECRRPAPPCKGRRAPPFPFCFVFSVDGATRDRMVHVGRLRGRSKLCDFKPGQHDGGRVGRSGACAAVKTTHDCSTRGYGAWCARGHLTPTQKTLSPGPDDETPDLLESASNQWPKMTTAAAGRSISSPASTPHKRRLPCVFAPHNNLSSPCAQGPL